MATPPRTDWQPERTFDFTSLGNDVQVPPRTVREFFTVLEDTLVGYTLPPYQRTKKRKPAATSKFYFFDVGVAHATHGVTQLAPGTAAYGRALEHLVANELRVSVLSLHRRHRLLHLDVARIIAGARESADRIRTAAGGVLEPVSPGCGNPIPRVNVC